MIFPVHSAEDRPLELEGLARPLHEYKIKSEVNGRVKKLYVDFNYLMKAGALLLEIEDSAAPDTVTKVVAPATATVIAVNAASGQTVKAGSPLLSMADLNQMLMVTYVPKTVLPRVTKGQAVQIKVDAYPNREFAATIESVATTATVIKGVRYFEVQALIDDYDYHIKPGMSGHMTLVPSKDAH